MAALPYMQFFVADYLADTAHLTTVQHGAYLLLIMNYWQRGKPLPAKDEYLSQICRLNLEQWLEIKPIIAEFFKEKKDQWTHSRIDKDLLAVTCKSNRLSKAGKASSVKRMLNKCSTNVEQMPIYTQAQAQAQAQAEKEKDLPPAEPTAKELLSPEYQLFSQACACFGEDPSELCLTEGRKRIIQRIRGDRNVGAEKFITACKNRARDPAAFGAMSVTFFIDDDFKWAEKITKWANGVKYGNGKQQYVAKDANKGDGTGWDSLITVVGDGCRKANTS